MIYLLTIIAVALPVLGLLHYIYTYDQRKPEPRIVLFMTFVAGTIGGVFTFFFDKYVGIADIYTAHPTHMESTTTRDSAN